MVRKISKNGFEFYVIIKNKGRNLFWDMYEDGSWEPMTFKVFSEILIPDDIYVDIGAWIGPTVLYAANVVQKIFAFEPDPYAFEELKENLELNPQLNEKIILYKAALTNFSGKVCLTALTGLGDSSSSIILDRGAQSVEVEAWRARSIFSSQPISEATFIKVDIEGGEYSLIPNMKRFLSAKKPLLYLSLHLHMIGVGKPKIIRRVLKFYATSRLLLALRSYKNAYLYTSNEWNLSKKLKYSLMIGIPLMRKSWDDEVLFASDDIFGN